MNILLGLCESADCDEVPIVLSHCLEEADSLKQCALLKKVSLLDIIIYDP